MNNPIYLVTNAKGRQLAVLLEKNEFKNNIDAVISATDDDNCLVARRFDIRSIQLKMDTNTDFNRGLLESDLPSDSIFLSFGLTKLFLPEFLDQHPGKVFNSHFSMLPSFPGKLKSDWTAAKLGPRSIFERALLYGVRFTGNTIHQVDASVDGGRPVIQSCMPIPYNTDQSALRHLLFIQECKCIFQFVDWVGCHRIEISPHGTYIRDADFSSHEFSPSIEAAWIKSFNIDQDKFI